MKAAMCGRDEPYIEGICDKEGKLIKPYVRNEVKNGGAEKPV